MKSITGKAMKNGNVSRIHVRRVSFGEIPDQTQHTITISNNTNGYFLNNMRSFMLISLIAYLHDDLIGGPVLWVC